MGNFPHVSPGQVADRPSAAFHNALVDAVAWIAGRANHTGASPTALGQQAGIVPVMNITGAALAQWAVVALQSPINDNTANLEEFQQRPAFRAYTPAAANAGRFGILLEPLPANAVGLAVVDGLSIAKVNVKHETDAHADLIDGDTTALQSGHHGAEILWKESGTGNGKWAIVRIGPREHFRHFRLKTYHAGGDVSTVAYQAYWNGSAWAADTAVEFTVYGRVTDTPYCLANALGLARWVADAGRWEIVHVTPPARWIRFALLGDLYHSTLSQTATVLGYWDGDDPDPTDAGVAVLNNAGSGESGLYQFAGRTGEIGYALREPVGNYRIITLSPNDFDPATFDVVTRVTATAYYTRQLKLPKGCTWAAEVEHAAAIGGADAFQ